jgi:hypothetical protein
MTLAIQLLGLFSSGAAAMLWLRGAFIAVPNNLDTIVQELQRIGHWNAAAAVCSCVAFACQAYLFWYGPRMRPARRAPAEGTSMTVTPANRLKFEGMGLEVVRLDLQRRFDGGRLIEGRENLIQAGEWIDEKDRNQLRRTTWIAVLTLIAALIAAAVGIASLVVAIR